MSFPVLFKLKRIGKRNFTIVFINLISGTKIKNLFFLRIFVRKIQGRIPGKISRKQTRQFIREKKDSKGQLHLL